LAGGVGALLTAVVLSGCSGTPGFPTGLGTATITWQRAGGGIAPPPQPYSGTSAGIPVSGQAVAPSPSSHISSPIGGPPLPSRITLARWTGSFEGKPFALTLSLNTAELPNFTTLAVDISGTFGADHVTGTAGGSQSQPNVLQFSVAVGHHHVVGTVKPFQAHGAANTAMASFTVTG